MCTYEFTIHDGLYAAGPLGEAEAENILLGKVFA